MKRKPGRPSKLTPELIAELARVVREGHVIEVACRAVGIGPVIYYEWMKVGEQQPESIHGQFLKQLKEAEATAELETLRQLKRSHGKDDPWQRYAWLLERRWPARWAKQPDVVVQTTPVSQAIREAPTERLLKVVNG